MNTLSNIRCAARSTAVRSRARLVLAITAVVLAACTDPHKTVAVTVPVTVTKVQSRNVPYEVDATGTVEPLQTVAVASQVGGVLVRVDFREGDEVRRDQVLFEIDPRPFQAALQQAQALRDKDSAQLITALQDEQRYAQLVQKDYVTAQQYDQAKANAASLRATVDADRAAVETARLNLEYATIRSPIAGRAGALLVKPGNLVKANGQTLVTINQLRPILVRFAVSAVHLPRIRQYASDSLTVMAQPATGVGTPSRGTFTFLDNAVDTTTGTIMLKGLFPNADAALWPGEFVNLALELFVEKGAIVVPSAAVVQSQSGTFVFVVDTDGAAKQRLVTVERTAGDLAVISKGLSAGETVITDGQLRVTDGTKVQIKAAAASDQPRT